MFGLEREKRKVQANIARILIQIGFERATMRGSGLMGSARVLATRHEK